METLILKDKTTIEKVLRRNVDLHIYGIGDLDDFFRPYTTWYAVGNNTDIREITLLYTGQALPALLAFSEHLDIMRHLLESILHMLPHEFYAHLTPGLATVFKKTHDLDFKGEYLKMALCRESVVKMQDCPDTVSLGHNDIDALDEFYRKCYPGNWFDPRLLDTRQFYGIHKDGQLISAAGVHVYSKKYRVAALGNIATAAPYRTRGYGRQVTARVCRSLLQDECRIGLNVKADNTPAISCYRKLGFDVVASYGEYVIQRKRR